jgi:hypothetical protein
MSTSKSTELLESLALTHSLLEKVRWQIEKTERLIEAEIKESKKLAPQEVPILLRIKKAIQIVQKYPSDWEGFKVEILPAIILNETFSSNYLYQLQRLIEEIKGEMIGRITEQEILRANKESISYSKTESEVKQWLFFSKNHFYEREREAYVLGKCHEKYLGWEIHFSYDLLKNQDIHEIGLYNGQTLYSNNIKRNPSNFPKHLHSNDTNGILNWVKSLIDELEEKWKPIFLAEHFEEDYLFQADTCNYTEKYHNWTLYITYDTEKTNILKIVISQGNIVYVNHVNANHSRISGRLAINDVDGVLDWLRSILDEVMLAVPNIQPSEMLGHQTNWASIFSKNHFGKAHTSEDITTFEDKYREWSIQIEFHTQNSQIYKIAATKGNIKYVLYVRSAPDRNSENLLPNTVNDATAWVKKIIDRGSQTVVPAD